MEKKFKNIIIICVVFMIIGIFIVNLNSPQSVKNRSNINIYVKDTPPKIVLELGKRELILNTAFLYYLKNGVITLIENIVN